MEETHKSFELKLVSERDAEAYQKQMDEGKRLSFEQRNEEAFKVRLISQKCQKNTLQEAHKSFELNGKLGKKCGAFQKISGRAETVELIFS